jgi:hypothetical protein
MKLKALGGFAALMIGSAPNAGAETSNLRFPNPESDKSQIVFWRQGTILGAAIGCSVFQNGEKLLELGAGRYQILDIKPGTHVFTNRSGGMEVTTASGQRRFVQCKITSGMFAGTPTLSISDESTFAKRLPKLKPQEYALSSPASE